MKSEATLLRLLGSLAVVSVLAVVLPHWLHAQNDTDLFHTTLRGWAEDTWLLIAHRTGSLDGRFSERGILQRFNRDVDNENQLDYLTFRFPMAEQYRWWKSDNGFRWTGSSVTRRDLITRGEFRGRWDVNDDWDLGARIDLETNYSFDRALVRLNGSRRLSQSLRIGTQLSLDPTKPDSDLEFGLTVGRNTKRNVIISVAMLDWLNDVIYIKLKAYEQSQIDTTINYDSHPFALRTNADYAFSQHFRAEFYGAIMTPTSLRAYERADTSAGFRQDERFGYVGSNLEWSPSWRQRIGAFGTYVAARTKREALSAAEGIAEYDLTERTAQLGAYLMRQFSTTWHLEAWIAREWRTERRIGKTEDDSDVDYLDEGWIGQVLLVRRPTVSGFQLDVGVAGDTRTVVRDDGRDPLDSPSLDRHNYRGRIDLGWRFTPKLSAWLGAGFDLDGDGHWGGGRARLSFYW
jgi:hypothetical protein